MVDPLEDTVELHVTEYFSRTLFHHQAVPSHLSIGAASDVGKVRKENQDHYAVIRRQRSQEIVLSDLPIDEFEGSEDFAHLLLVADGIGGSSFGELASRIVIHKVWELAAHSASWIMKLKDFDAQQIRERIEAYAYAMQQSLDEQIRITDGKEQSLGTTLTAAYVIGMDAIISHVGDSRAYLLRDGVLIQQTEDQTLARKLLDLGHDQSQVKKFHNILSNWFGTGVVRNPYVEIRHLNLKTGDKILLCSDGLTKELSNEEIQEILAAAETPQAASDNLLATALRKGGRDNVTVVVAEVEQWLKSPESQPAQ